MVVEQVDGRERADSGLPVARQRCAPTSGVPFAWYSPPIAEGVNIAVALALETAPAAEMVVRPEPLTVVAAETVALGASAKKEIALDCALAVKANIRAVPAEVTWQQENIDTVPGFAAAVRDIRSTVCRSAALHHFQTDVVHYYSGSAGSNSCYSYCQKHPRMCEFLF